MDLAQILGGNMAYVGFTGATGGETATQDILSWSGQFALNTVPPPPPLPGGGGSRTGPVGLPPLAGTELLPVTFGPGSVVATPASSGQASPSGNHRRGLADLLASDPRSQADGVQTLHQAVASAPGSDLTTDALGQGLDVSALDAVFSRM